MAKRGAKQKSKTRQQRPTIATYLQRSIDTRDELPRFLIVCEGEKTEPHYFEALAAELRVSVNVRIIGLGDNTDSLVERAIARKSEDEYLQAWCVFDRDSFPAQRFNRAIQLAHNSGFRVAYSNEAFELWYILHFEYLQAGLLRDAYKKKLTGHLGKPYRKNNRAVFNDLKANQPIALQNAAQLLASYSEPNPEQDNPSTTVHLLVLELAAFWRE